MKNQIHVLFVSYRSALCTEIKRYEQFSFPSFPRQKFNFIGCLPFSTQLETKYIIADVKDTLSTTSRNLRHCQAAKEESQVKLMLFQLLFTPCAA